MKKKRPISPKADPQMWANGEHLDHFAAQHGAEASGEEYARMFQPGGELPPIEERHVGMANSYRRFHELPLLPRNYGQKKAEPEAEPQHAGKK